MKLTFLGTGNAIPTASRNHTSTLLEHKDDKILIDCGEGTQRQFRKAKINPCKLTKILITHWHGDHVLGLPGLFQTLSLNNYNKKLKIYGPKGTKKFINEIIKIFLPKTNLKLEVIEIKNKTIKEKDFEISSLSLEHGVPCNGYSFKEIDKLKINKLKLKKLKIPQKERSKIAKLSAGKNIKINKKLIKAKDYTTKQIGKKISFIFDTKKCNNAIKLAKNSNISIIESTYSKEEQKLATKYKHMTTYDAATIAKKAKVKKLIINHISQRYEHKEDSLLKEAKKIFKNTIIANDLMELEL